jgi:hypothetical protein
LGRRELSWVSPPETLPYSHSGKMVENNHFSIFARVKGKITNMKYFLGVTYNKGLLSSETKNSGHKNKDTR